MISGITLRSALKLLLENVNGTELTYVIEDEVMKITTAEKANENYQTRVYPVGDLVIPIPVISAVAGESVVVSKAAVSKAAWVAAAVASAAAAVASRAVAVDSSVFPRRRRPSSEKKTAELSENKQDALLRSLNPRGGIRGQPRVPPLALLLRFLTHRRRLPRRRMHPPSPGVC